MKALNKIKFAKIGGSKRLDLSGLGLNAIPEEVCELKALENLDLSNNKISEIEYIDQLTRLKVLDLSSNRITEIKSLEQLTQLEVLELGNNRITEIQGLDQLESLEVLSLGRNAITEVKGLERLFQLNKLVLSSNQISEIKGLQRLTGLRILNFHGNRISEIKGLEHLSKLTILNLVKNQIQAIKGIDELRELEEINLGHNEISEITGLEFQLKLNTLRIHYNKIKVIEGLDSLASLKVLNLSHNQINAIQGLDQQLLLAGLELRGNRIDKITGLDQIQKLMYLDLRNNQILEISGLGRMRFLRKLFLSSNPITDVRGLDQLTSLSLLSLEWNKIQVIPRQLLNLNLDIVWTTGYLEKGVSIGGNPVEQPPIEIVEQGNEAIRRYWEQIEEQGADYLYEAKLILVGDGGAGKSTLLKQLQGIPDIQNTRTRGVDIHRHTFTNRTGQTFDLNVWDFGGQDIYYAVHRFFLTENSLYLLLTNTRSPEDNFDYWIPNIALFGGRSPIVAIKNKWDGFQRDISIKRFVQEEAFYVINQIFEANLLSGDGFEKIRKTIYHHTQDLPHIGQTVPKTWLKVRNVLKELDSTFPYISYARFEGICSENDIDDSIRIRDLARYFHDLGIVLWYCQIPQLADKIILQPEWVTDAVYRVIDDQKVQDKKGHFDSRDLVRLWKEDYYKGMHSELLELMKAFRLCYKKRGKEEYIIPALLIQDENTDHWTPGPSLQVEYVYQFLPKGIVNQLTAELYQEIKAEDSVWSRGVILQIDLAEARVVEDWYKRKVLIEVQGIAAKALLQIIMRELDVINESYAGISVNKWVPCICEYCQGSGELKRFRYDKLVDKLRRGKKLHTCDEDDRTVSLEALLLNVGYQYTEYGSGLVDGTIPHVLFSYAEEDEGFRDKLEKQLSQLKRKKEIVVWAYNATLAGQVITGVDYGALREADIVIQLLSSDYTGSDEIMQQEYNQILGKVQKGEVHLIPVHVRPCLWDGVVPKGMQILPRNQKAISTFSNQDAIFVEVAKEIMEVIKEVRRKKSA